MRGSEGEKLLDVKAVQYIQTRKLCDRTCPGFPLCPVMPLAVQPKDIKRRVCLVNNGPPEIQRAYKNLFVGGHSGIVEEMTRSIMEYGKLLRGAGKTLSVKDKLRYHKDLNTMLQNLDKIVGPSRKAGEDEQEAVEIDTGEEIPDPESLINSPMFGQVLKNAGGEDYTPTVAKPVEPPKEHPMIARLFGAEEK
jgi:hypothetical protein